MNNEYYQNMPGSPLFYGNEMVPNQTSVNTNPSIQGDYIENILQKTEPIKAIVFMTFPDSNEWRDRKFDGIIEGSGRDHIVVSDPKTGSWFVLPMIYVDYIQFDENIQKYLK